MSTKNMMHYSHPRTFCEVVVKLALDAKYKLHIQPGALKLRYEWKWKDAQSHNVVVGLLVPFAGDGDKVVKARILIAACARLAMHTGLPICYDEPEGGLKIDGGKEESRGTYYHGFGSTFNWGEPDATDWNDINNSGWYKATMSEFERKMRETMGNMDL